MRVHTQLHLQPPRVTRLRSPCPLKCARSHKQALDLSDNALEALPGGACAPGHWERLTRLTALDVRGNPLASLPSSLGPRAAALAAGLRYDPEELADLPPEAAAAGAGPLLAYLAGCHASLAGGRLDLSGRGLAAVPRHVGGMAHLIELRLGRNPIAELPE
jgi:Leucine-rich repeat (LRR) protein